MLEGQRHHFGLSEERVGLMLEQCRKSGLSATEADVLLASVRAARNESLPAEAVFTKIEEGLVKKVALDRVTAATELRLNCLRRANQLLSAQKLSSAHSEGHGGNQRLVVRMAMALESGLPEEVFQEIFSRRSGCRYGRLIHVMEAGETLQLAGLNPQEIKQIMMDCIDRDLNRMEIQRAVDCVVEQYQNGQDFQSIRAGLWVHAE
jgi:hypothetical protein